jgi:SAM-dependent methyltransferase
MQLYIGGLPQNTTENDIETLLSKICPVQSITLARDIESGKPKGFALVKLAAEEDGEKAVNQLGGQVLKGVKIIARIMPDTLPGEMEFREWLSEHASDVLRNIGVKEGQTIMDYGCGPGLFVLPGGRMVGKTGKVYALDVRSKMLAHVKQKADVEGLTNVVTILQESSYPGINLKDEALDVVLVYDVMHEIKDRVGLLKELHRVVKPDGLLSIFPMHMGTEKMLDIMNSCDLFSFRDRFSPPGYKGASEILNFVRR